MRTQLTELPLIAFDEAGNTGQNLLDPAQPIFVAASVHLSKEEAQRLLAVVTGANASEAKFTRLRKSASGRARLVKMFSDSLIADDRVKVSAYHKRFMITTKIVDLIEPKAHRAGVDLYEGAANLGLANLWHHVMGVFCGQENYDELLRRFVQMVRNKTPDNVESFYRQVQHLRTTNTDPDFDSDLLLILSTIEIIDELIDASDRVAIDPAIPAFVDLAAQWSATLGVPFRIAHDRSKPIEHQKEMLETLMSLSDEGRVFTNFGPSWRLPLLSSGIEFVDSVDVPQVQVADLIAGASMMVLDGKAKGNIEEFTKELMNTNFAELSYTPVWPTFKVTPAELHADQRPGSAALDYTIEVSRRGRERRDRHRT